MTRLAKTARRLAAGGALAAIAMVAQAGTTKTTKPSNAIALPKLEQFTLDNGLKVAFMQVDTAPVVTVQVWYHAGSKDEPRDRRGSAHMFEHIMFKGSTHVPPEEHARDINQIGGYVNAQTTEDATFFFETMPKQYLDFALELEAERMRNLVFDEGMIKTEKEVVKEEIRQRENSPIQMGFTRFREIAYAKHPYAWDSGGRLSDLDATTPADLEKFYDAYYQPNNALVVVVGDVTLDEVKKSVQDRFGSIPKAADPARPADAATEPVQTEKHREVVDPGQIGLAFVGWHIPAAKDADSYAVQILQLVLGAGDSARLHQRAHDDVDPKTKQPYVLDAGVSTLLLEHPGMLMVVAAFRDPAYQDHAEKMLFDEVAKVVAKGITADELRKAKNQIQAGFVYGLENSDGIANQIGESWILDGDPAQFLGDVDRLEKVTLDDVQRVAKTYLDPEKSTTVIVPIATAPKGGK